MKDRRQFREFEVGHSMFNVRCSVGLFHWFVVVTGLFLVGASASAGDETATESLIAVLQSDAGVEEKAKACRQLGEVGTGEAVPALKALLSDNVLAAYARAGLERISDSNASAALRNSLATTSGTFLVGVINSLAALRDEKAVSGIIKLTGHKDEKVVQAASLALGRIASDFSIKVVLSALTDRAFRREPNDMENAAAACLLAAQVRLQNREREMPKRLYDAVRREELPLSYRVGATKGAILARDGDQQVSFLVEQLNSSEPAIRNVALLTIREVPSDALATALHGELAKAAPYLQVQLIAALKDCHNVDTYPVVRRLLESDLRPIRLAAGHVLAHLGGDDSAVTADYLRVLERNRTPKETAQAKRKLLQSEGHRWDEQVLKSLAAAESDENRIQLIGLLGAKGARIAVPELLKQAGDANDDVRIAALQALKGLAGPDQVPRLIELVKASEGSAEKTVAVSAATSACSNDESKELVLAEMKSAADPAIRSAWIRIMTETGYPKALPFIVATLNQDNATIAAETITHLSRWPNPAPVEDLLAGVEGSENAALRRRALAAAIQLVTVAADQKQRKSDVLIGWLERANKAIESVQQKRQIVSALARVPNSGSLDLLKPYLADADVNKEAAFAVVNVVEHLSADSDRAAARAALDQIGSVHQTLRKQIEDLKERLAEK
jgi:HEAT repeat protein